jgi:hypothetical protein
MTCSAPSIQIVYAYRICPPALGMGGRRCGEMKRKGLAGGEDLWIDCHISPEGDCSIKPRRTPSRAQALSCEYLGEQPEKRKKEKKNKRARSWSRMRIFYTLPRGLLIWWLILRAPCGSERVRNSKWCHGDGFPWIVFRDHPTKGTSDWSGASIPRCTQYVNQVASH